MVFCCGFGNLGLQFTSSRKTRGFKTIIMFLTNILLKKAKSKMIMVLMESVVSGHQVTRIRERLADKLEYIRFDPYIQQESLYKERKKIRSIKSS